ncbi:MAG: (Fe-S)-binding protein [Thermoplasmata archaeon]|nr:(Fe-S)-binding protein [Thermoplasmata archaeon]MCJ7562770.1 (Fe-S)-binding protein [Thermoplasmata archaeon]
MNSLEEFKDELETCFGTSCGFCERGCPVYQSLKVKTLCMKGRNRTMLGLLQGRFEITPAVVEAAFECTLCGNCDRWCSLKNTEHTRAFREYLLTHGIAPMKEHASLAASIKNYGNPWFQPRSARNRWTRGLNIPKAAPGKQDTLFFAGCTSAVMKPLIPSLVASAKLLQKAGVQFATMGQDEPCCGSTLRRVGQTDAFEDLEKKNLEKFEALGIKKIVTACPGCYTTLKESLEKAGSKIQVVHVAQEISDLVKSGKLKVNKTHEKMTYHDPCHLGRLGGVFEEPREIVKAVAELVEMPNSRYESRCCGAGAGLQSAFPKLSRDLASKRIAEAKATGATKIITCCPFCETQLRTVPGIDVVDLMELLLDASENEKEIRDDKEAEK